MNLEVGDILRMKGNRYLFAIVTSVQKESVRYIAAKRSHDRYVPDPEGRIQIEPESAVEQLWVLQERGQITIEKERRAQERKAAKQPR